MAVYGNFEVGTERWFVSGAGLFERVNDRAYRGSWSAHVITSANDLAGGYHYGPEDSGQGFPVEPGKNYRLVVAVEGAEGGQTNCRLLLAGYSGAGSSYLGNPGDTGPITFTDDGFSLYTLEFNTNGPTWETITHVRTYVAVFGSVEREFWFDWVRIGEIDDVEITPSKATLTLIGKTSTVHVTDHKTVQPAKAVYGNFEVGTERWFVSGAGLFERVNDRAYRGSWSAHVITSANDLAGGYHYGPEDSGQGFPVEPGKNYRLVVAVEGAAGGQTNCRLLLAGYSGAGSSYLGNPGDTGPITFTDDGFSLYTLEFNTHGSTWETITHVRTYVAVFGPVEREFWFDWVRIGEIDDVVLEPAKATLQIVGKTSTVHVTDNNIMAPARATLSIVPQTSDVAVTANVTVAPARASLKINTRLSTVHVTDNRTVKPTPASLKIVPKTSSVVATANITLAPVKALLSIVPKTATVSTTNVVWLRPSKSTLRVVSQTASVAITRNVWLQPAGAHLSIVPKRSPLITTIRATRATLKIVPRTSPVLYTENVIVRPPAALLKIIPHTSNVEASVIAFHATARLYTTAGLSARVRVQPALDGDVAASAVITGRPSIRAG